MPRAWQIIHQKVMQYPKTAALILAMGVYVLLWCLSSSTTSRVLLTQVVAENAPVLNLPISLPYVSRKHGATPASPTRYRVTGEILMPVLSTADTLVLITDNCPLTLLINGAAPSDMALPVTGTCNMENRQFLISAAALHRGSNSFELEFEDNGGIYGVSLTTKSVWLKKTLMLVVPALFIALFGAACGATRESLARPSTIWAALILLLGVFFLCFSHATQSQTYDEGSHTAAGMQWWDKGEYSFEYMHMPLARIAAASLPYAFDITPKGDYQGWFFYIGNRIFHSNDDYVGNLTLARLGIIPFYLLGGVVVFIWSRQLFGSRAALLSLLLYAAHPAIAGHAGVAATDLPYAAMFIAALYAFVLWLERPALVTSLFLGVTTACMFLTKISCVVQFPVAVALVLEWHIFFLIRERAWRTIPWKRFALLACCVVLPVFVFLVEATYF
ncbi:MAG: glycosyltransferase family 39 protein, partial [Rickettsiales bacterium]|nr:glycosyltransferase family 39 protein [Rickettsiales bacterium]